MNQAYIIFEFRGQRYEYDGGMPAAVLDAVPHLLDNHGNWVAGYPVELLADGADAFDDLPAALWEIEHVGGRVLETHGARADGSIHAEDWKTPRVY